MGYLERYAFGLHAELTGSVAGLALAIARYIAACGANGQSSVGTARSSYLCLSTYYAACVDSLRFPLGLPNLSAVAYGSSRDLERFANGF